MGVTVLGIQHRVGEYEGVHYDNYNLHCVEEVSGDTWRAGAGLRTSKKSPLMCIIRQTPLTRFCPGTNITSSITVLAARLMYN